MSEVTPVGDEIETTTDIEPLPPLPPMPRPKPKRWPLFLGLALTVGYLVFAVVVSNRLGIMDLDADKLGDFLSGIFAPLAFLWLVLGFLQQGEELRNSANALWMQGEELRAAVNQQRAMVVLTREQNQHLRRRDLAGEADARRRAQPRFNLQPQGSGPAGDGTNRRRYSFLIYNTGAPVTDVRLKHSGWDAPFYQTMLQTGGQMTFFVNHLHGELGTLGGRITFIDALGNEGERSLRVHLKLNTVDVTIDAEDDGDDPA